MVFIFFVLGLIIGSFLNVVIARLGTFETILGRSFCRHCRKKISWYDNVPLVSFLVLLGKCRHCGEKISWQYPIIESVTAILFTLFGVLIFSTSNAVNFVEMVFIWGILACAIILFVYDLKRMEIPMGVLWFGIVWTITFFLWLDWAMFDDAVRSVFDLRLYNGFIAGLGAFFFFFSLSAVSRERWMGFGDAYVAFWIGLLLGWPLTLLSLMSAFSLGAVVGIALMVFARYTMASRLPFAPFLLLSMMIFLFIHYTVPAWHFENFFFVF